MRDDIEISYGTGPVDVDLHVQEALARAALVPDDSDVQAAAKGSTIMLTGHVRTWAEHDAVVDAAWMAAVSLTSATTWPSPADLPNRAGNRTTVDRRVRGAARRGGGELEKTEEVHVMRGKRFWATNPDRRRESETADGALTRTLTATDRCDRCGARAYVRVLLPVAWNCSSVRTTLGSTRPP